jgi:hypothetical protein
LTAIPPPETWYGVTRFLSACGCTVSDASCALPGLYRDLLERILPLPAAKR